MTDSSISHSSGRRSILKEEGDTGDENEREDGPGFVGFKNSLGWELPGMEESNAKMYRK